MMMTYLSYEQTLDYVLEHAEALQFRPDSDRAVTRLQHIRDSAGPSLTLPLTFPAAQPGESLVSYLESVPDTPPAQLILLLQAGHAALGYFDTECTHHKVISKYMVRRGQGKAQLTFSKTRGKSRLGSRIRLQQSLAYFREINEKLSDWSDQIDATEQIFLSCPIRFRHELFHGKTQPPFTEEDSRLRKVPFSTHRPTFKELNRIRFLLKAGILDVPDEIEPFHVQQPEPTR